MIVKTDKGDAIINDHGDGHCRHNYTKYEQCPECLYEQIAELQAENKQQMNGYLEHCHDIGIKHDAEIAALQAELAVVRDELGSIVGIEATDAYDDWDNGWDAAMGAVKRIAKQALEGTEKKDQLGGER